MINIYDNFLPEQTIELIKSEVMALEFFDEHTHPRCIEERAEKEAKGEEYNMSFPDTRTEALAKVAPILDGYLLRVLESVGSSFCNRTFRYDFYATLRLESSEDKDYIHQDPVDFACLLYLSDTNLKSGTKMYSSVKDDKEEEDCFVKFVKNRLVMYSGMTPHRPWGVYGTDRLNGRLTINGFFEYI